MALLPPQQTPDYELPNGSDDHNDVPPSKPHLEAADRCANPIHILVSWTDTHSYLAYINAIYNLTSHQ